MNRTFLTLSAALLLTLALTNTSTSQTGATGLSVLKNGVGARGIGLGETGVADATFGFASFYNPSLISRSEMPALSLSHEISVQDVNSQYVGAVIPFSGWTLGFHMHLASVDNIEVRTKPGEAEGDFTSRNFSTGITASVPLADRLSFGATFKFLFEKIYVDDASGFGVDLGLAMQPFDEGALKSLELGAAVANLGSMSAMLVESSALPTLLRAGASYSPETGIEKVEAGVRAEAFSVFKEKKVSLHAGLEAGYDGLVYLRVGYQSGSDIKNVSGGFGIVYGPLRIDYAFVPYMDQFGTAHTFAVSLLF